MLVIPVTGHFQQQELGSAGEAAACIIMFFVIAIGVSYSLLIFFKNKTWEAAAFGCFFFWMTPFLMAPFAVPSYILLLWSIVPTLTIIYVAMLFKKTIIETTHIPRFPQ
jgi:hypothetical protein